MFGIGFQELVLLSLIGLIVLGPERLPRVANQIGTWLGQARRMTRVMKRQLEDELNFEKEFRIEPPSREPSTQPPSGIPNPDDKFSAAHETAAPGTTAGDGELPAAHGGAVAVASETDRDAAPEPETNEDATVAAEAETKSAPQAASKESS